MVMACCGDTPTLETLAAVTILRKELPELKIRVVNVVDLMKLQPHTEHPHGLTDEEYDTLFTKDKPIIFAYHGYPTLIHELTYRRAPTGISMSAATRRRAPSPPPSICGYSTTLTVSIWSSTLCSRLPQLGNRGAYLVQKMNDKLVEHTPVYPGQRRGPAGSPQLEMGGLRPLSSAGSASTGRLLSSRPVGFSQGGTHLESARQFPRNFTFQNLTRS